MDYSNCTLIGNKGYISCKVQLELFEIANIRLKVPYTKAIRKNENRHFLFYQSKKKDLNHVLAFM